MHTLWAWMADTDRMSAVRRTEIDMFVAGLLLEHPFLVPLASIALTYLRRLRAVPRCVLASKNIQALFATALMLADKFWLDDGRTLRQWSELTGFSVAQLRRMEHSLLSLLDWNLYVN